VYISRREQDHSFRLIIEEQNDNRWPCEEEKLFNYYIEIAADLLQQKDLTTLEQ
jgi:hypothetical protein